MEASEMPGDDRPELDNARGIFAISVAAELTGIGAQQLRLYETKGLLEPVRTDGGTRRYSHDDLHRLRHISALLGDGLNLAGIAAVLCLEQENALLRADVEEGAPPP
jgi:MerR family transcriptional regulator/heat shock protein HspR